MKLDLAKHTIITFSKNGIFLLYQMITRKGVLIEKDFFNHDINNPDPNKSYNFQDISTFSLSNSLVDNPSGILNTKNITLRKKNILQIIEICKKHFILSDGDSYTKLMGPKDSFFDKKHLGNFHQQIGEYVYRNSNQDSEGWWIFQKFEKNLSNTRNNPYRWVQEDFIKSFFTKKLLSQKSVLDFGCGIGYYSHFFATKDANVVGVDPSESYIKMAKNLYSKNKNLLFAKNEFRNLDDFKKIKGSFDYIFLSDVLLYFFVPYKENNISPSELLKALALKLNTGGKIYIMDPHGVFHLQPWFNSDAPYMLMTEYANRKFRVTPNLEELSIAIEKSGLKISKIRELKGKENGDKFYNEFPFWWFFELTK